MIKAPALYIDHFMKEKYGTEVSADGRLERRIVANLIHHLEQRGFQVHRLNDGESIQRVKDMKEAMELIFNLDEASLRFIPVACAALSKAEQDRREHGVLLVLGNGIDIISDWNYTEGDPDGFHKAMDAFNVEQFA